LAARLRWRVPANSSSNAGAMADFGASLRDRGLDLEGQLQAKAVELDPLEPVLPPEGVTAARLRDVASDVLTAESGRVDVSGVRGAAGPALTAEIARKRRVVVVTVDLETAAKLAGDVRFFLGRDGDGGDGEDGSDADVLVFPAQETSPYADVNPDRRAAMSRMAVLSRLADGRGAKVLVLPVSALARKGVPRAVVQAHTYAIEVDSEIDREALVLRLSESGYLRVPVVEDPGTFAVRGALFDVWPPGEASPRRVELYGDLVLSIKPFDPFEQRTPKDGSPGASLRKVILPPAREAILTEEHERRAREGVRLLADAVDLPTTKTRSLVEDVASGRAFFGADGFLPAYYPVLESLSAYFTPETVFVVVDPPAITVALEEELTRARDDVGARVGHPHFPREAFFDTADTVALLLDSRRVLVLHTTPIVGDDSGPASDAALSPLARFEVAPKERLFDVAARDHADLSRAVKNARARKGKGDVLLPLVRRISYWREAGLRVVISARADTQVERITTLLRHQGVMCEPRTGSMNAAWLTEPAQGPPIVVRGGLSAGVVLPAEGLALVTEEEVFGARVHRPRKTTATDVARPFLEDLRSLSVGDFVVHVEHGIGRYQGLVHKTIGGLTVDLLSVEYAGGDKLYLPVHRLNQIQKYSGGENAEPKVDRLGGATFAKTKSRVEKAVRQMADELLRLYAERKAQPGFALDPAGDDYRAFEATFPFEETPDQARAIEDVNRDLETDKPMDRLVCGDVGFGKTEVAVRAAFRVAMAGKQVALLCPTTILAQQHYRLLESRLRDYPITVRPLSRFASQAEQAETLSLVKSGKVDIVVGTHRLLSKDVHFHDLGLLVIDEEQRFGVAHKERMKQLRATVDVLTLSATPIPRTLQMAVSGLRDLSLITTPPTDRRAVRTIVTRFDEQLLREAIQRELSRGGQVFYVYNRIEGIHEKAHRLTELVPGARIVVGHGQMAGKGKTKTEAPEGGEHISSALEKVMFDFVEGRYDILVATAIVENGLDIPRANTILIDRADLFGLAQLYQLRGRVGRSRERAYCYLIVPPANAMTDEARSRIDALERHTELGSGFQIASLDLELRGAGDLLGGEQSGNVASVGFELFCHMLEEAVHEMRGEPVVHDVDPDLSFDVTALLPESYVSEVGVRLSLYKRLASADDEAHVADIAAEMENRFGEPPAEARCLVKLMSLKTELRRLKVLGCEASARSVTLVLREDTPLDTKKVTELVRRAKSPYKLTPDMRLSRRFDGEGNGVANAEVVLAELARCVREG
jgi:transcription-repair coupling factor (superfamily II helicase)